VTLNFSRQVDPERPGVHYYNANLGDGRSVIVQEVSIGVWGWLIVNERDGSPLEMRNGFADAAQSMSHVASHLGFMTFNPHAYLDQFA
jgi:hypothetical protein